MSPKRFDGWEPAEVHEFFDAEDQPCTADQATTVVVTREAEWDHATRVRALEFQKVEDGKCSCGCGQPMDEAHNEDTVYLVDTYKCQAGRALDMVRRQRREDAKKEGLPDGWDDGLHFYARKATAKDFAKKGMAPPVPTPAGPRQTKLERIRTRSAKGGSTRGH